MPGAFSYNPNPDTPTKRHYFFSMQTATIKTFEHRAKLRINASYPAIVQGKDANGKKIRVHATLVNLSPVGFGLILKPQFWSKADLFVFFRCSVTGPLGKSQAPLIALRGIPTHFDLTAAGLQTIEVKTRQSRFL